MGSWLPWLLHETNGADPTHSHMVVWTHGGLVCMFVCVYTKTWLPGLHGFMVALVVA